MRIEDDDDDASEEDIKPEPEPQPKKKKKSDKKKLDTPPIPPNEADDEGSRGDIIKPKPHKTKHMKNKRDENKEDDVQIIDSKDSKESKCAPKGKVGKKTHKKEEDGVEKGKLEQESPATQRVGNRKSASQSRVETIKKPLVEIGNEIRSLRQKKKKPKPPCYFIDMESIEDNSIHFDQREFTSVETTRQTNRRKRRAVIKETSSSDVSASASSHSEEDQSSESDVPEGGTGSSKIVVSVDTSTGIQHVQNESDAESNNSVRNVSDDIVSDRAEKVDNNVIESDDSTPNFDLVLKELNKVKSLDITVIKDDVRNLRKVMESGICPGSLLNIRDSFEKCNKMLQEESLRDPMKLLLTDEVNTLDSVSPSRVERLIGQFNKHNTQAIILVSSPIQLPKRFISVSDSRVGKTPKIKEPEESESNQKPTDATPVDSENGQRNINKKKPEPKSDESKPCPDGESVSDSRFGKTPKESETNQKPTDAATPAVSESDTSLESDEENTSGGCKVLCSRTTET